MMKMNKCVLSLVLVAGLAEPGIASGACVDDYPVKSVTSIGGGQSPTVNKTLTVTFRGHIVTTNGLSNRGRNVVKICSGTTVDYEFKSSVGGGRSAMPDCPGAFYFGALSGGGKISCNNKNLGGRDTDSFTIKEG